MVVSSAVMLPVMSGGLLVSEEDGCLLGMIVSISDHSIMMSQHTTKKSVTRPSSTSDQPGVWVRDRLFKRCLYLYITSFCSSSQGCHHRPHLLHC
ncbi:hypothetical protein GBAR_LOCUS30384 [Geodia barretti]|uniref:Uncharacterized protein n=1 Tax=Geodia barretti TaxID=519541 RepID=A0AA35TXI2_GEOBA|nr:hypothetical protein GBAR_LOCUS30384 [Geodia barretti]